MEEQNKQETYENFKREIETGQPLPKIQVPTGKNAINTVTIGQFAEQFGKIAARSNQIFFKPEIKNSVEIRKFTTEEGEEYLGFSELTGARLVTLAEKMAYLYAKIMIETDQGEKYLREVERNITVSQANLVTVSEQFLQQLNPIKRIFTIPIPILHDGKITFPKECYDPRFQSWLDPSNIKLEEMDVEKAKQTITQIFKEFCFEKDDEGKLTAAGEQSRVHAIAGLITPFLRGLYTSFNVRTPMFFYHGNRPRVGKDYCAAITGLLYEGVAIEEPPIATGKPGENTNEELRKKIMSVILQGRHRLHFSNNKGTINNAMIENIITSRTFSDRLLGKNEVATFDNELEFSMSGNFGVNLSPDLANRSRVINLFLDIEDPNARTFQTPKLHEWVLENRALILSAIYTLVKTWHDNGAKKGVTPYTSFQEWAEVCGGIMTYHSLGDPCQADCSGMAEEVDEETADMKKLFELLYEKFGSEPFTKRDIFDHLERSLDGEGGWQEQFSLFKWFEPSKQGSRSSFSKHFKRHVGRIYSGYKLKPFGVSTRTSRDKFYLKLVIDQVSGRKIKDETQKTLLGGEV